MRRRRLGPALLVSLVASLPLSASAKDGVGNSDVTFEFQGRTRHYVLYPPPAKLRPAHPALVLSLHGGGGSAKGQMLTDGLKALADEKGFILVYPEGIASMRLLDKIHVWNGGLCCGKAVEERVDDVAFLVEVIARLEKEFKVDAKQVYVTGLSNGAIMALRLACERPDLIGGVAPVAGALLVDHCAKTKTPVPLISIHGDADPCVPVSGQKMGGCFASLFKERTGISIKSTGGVALEPRAVLLDRWRGLGGLKGEGKVTLQKGAATCWRAGPNAGNFEVETCTVAGGGHAWPGGTYGSSCEDGESKGCKAFRKNSGMLSMDLDASREMVEFFGRHRHQ